MQKQSARIVALMGAIITWSAVLTQFYLIIVHRVVSVPETIFRFFGYFTIDTNIIVALCFSSVFLSNKAGTERFFSKPSTITATVVYITIVGIVYNTILRPLWKPQGLQMIVDEVLHSVTPVYFILFWVIFTPTKELKWKDAFSWLIYPLLYMLYAILLGAITKFYPYIFVDVSRHGYPKALSNAGLVLLAIFMLSLILIATGKLVQKVPDGGPKANKPI